MASFQMKVLYDGWPCNDSLLVSLKIYSDQDKTNAKWKHAYNKFDESGIGVRIQYFTTSNDTMTDLEVCENSFNFTLHYDMKSSLKIVGTEKDGDYHVDGIGLWWDNILKRDVNIKFYSIDTIPNYYIDGETILL